VEPVSHDLGPFADPEMVRRLIDDGMVLFAGIDGDGSISWMGRSSQTLLGRPATEVIGTSALDLIHPDDHEILLASLAESARDSTERIFAVVRVARTDGTWTTLEFGGIDLRTPDGQGTFLVWGRHHQSVVRLFDFLGSLLTAADLHHLLDQVVQWCDALMPYSSSLVLARGDDGTYRTAASAASLPTRLGSELVVDRETAGPWKQALTDGDPVDAPAAALSDVLGEAARAGGLDAGWILAVPSVDGSPPDGLLVTWRSRPGPMLVTHARHLREASRLCQLAFDWDRTHADLVVAATTDALTGLANRVRLRELVERHRSRPAALLFCDLDHFKELNDRYGHATGDQVLRAVALRMADAVRAGDHLVRLGGDEFVAWCPDLRDPRDADVVGGRILHALTAPVVVAGTFHDVGCSIGVAIADPDDGHHVDLDQLLDQADRALYRAKAAGRGGIAHHQAEVG
jgi:diguanylate cyclase (GGDEF)-like protein